MKPLLSPRLIQENKRHPDHFGTLGHEYEFFEGITANSELEWIDAEWCGDLTDAPILVNPEPLAIRNYAHLHR